MSTTDAPRRFEFRFANSYRTAAQLFGITPQHTGVTVSDDTLEARYGPWKAKVPLSNIIAVDVTGPYWFIKTAGPPRLGITDRGLTFASNGDRGVLITFKEPIRVMGGLRHPELTVTVANPDELARLLRERIGH